MSGCTASISGGISNSPHDLVSMLRSKGIPTHGGSEMKRFMVLMVLLVAMVALTLPAMAQVRDSKVAPPPADSAKATVTPAPAAPARPTLSDRNPVDGWLDANGNWHLRIYVNLPKAIEWSGQTPVPGPFTVVLGGLLCVEQDPTVTGVNGSTAVEFVIPANECKCQEEGCFLAARPADDGITVWPWTWNHPSRAKNDKGQQIGGYRLIMPADGILTWSGKQ